MHSSDGSPSLQQPAQPADQASHIVRATSKPEIEPAAASVTDPAHVHAADGAHSARCTPALQCWVTRSCRSQVLPPMLQLAGVTAYVAARRTHRLCQVCAHLRHVSVSVPRCSHASPASAFFAKPCAFFAKPCAHGQPDQAAGVCRAARAGGRGARGGAGSARGHAGARAGRQRAHARAAVRLPHPQTVVIGLFNLVIRLIMSASRLETEHKQVQLSAIDALFSVSREVASQRSTPIIELASIKATHELPSALLVSCGLWKQCVGIQDSAVLRKQSVFC